MATHVTRLRALVGRPVAAVHLLHGPDGWLPDAPVVVTVDGSRLEVCAWELDLSVTWGVLDLAAPAWPTSDRHDWRSVDDPVVGLELVGIDVVENSYSVTRRETGEVTEGWLLSGLRLRTPGPSLTVYNALDQNGLAADELEGMRYRPLPP